jgi:hypothetical protein
MDSKDFKDTLIASSPLPQSILDQVVAGAPSTMTSSDRQAVIDAQ